ncbi:MAG: hypothetical protein QNJ46_03950 [Leptolyngbyaceae cyanobacterium MO_188.B28]|nr:hypothetical protein [Leptolyngbyaceae cyanobacterium MO_188.B28]
MIGVVISLNIAIALFCLFIVWRVWRLKRMLAKVSDTLLAWERSTYRTLYQAPDHILNTQGGIAHLRKQHIQLRFRLRQVRQVLALVFLLQRLFFQRSQWLKRYLSKAPAQRLKGRAPISP